jgi:hypothetical protein
MKEVYVTPIPTVSYYMSFILFKINMYYYAPRRTLHLMHTNMEKIHFTTLTYPFCLLNPLKKIRLNLPI